MSPKLHEFVVLLQRDGILTPWGIRIVGGSDLDTPLIITKVQCGSPAHGELLRGDIIVKIGEYDARDLRHEDAQILFRTAGNEIKLAVHRDNKIALTQGLSNESSRCSSTVPPASPINCMHPNPGQPHRAPSPFIPGPGHYETALAAPVNTLPHTVFPKLNESGGYIAPARPDSAASISFCPMPSRDHQQEVQEETAAIVSQPYRTTPLILPGAKVKKDIMPTESYLRHHPNPAIRARPAHDFQDVLMKQKVADTVLHRVVGEDAASGKVAHRQFNSPIGLYSDSNIENTIRQTVPSQGSPSPLARSMPSKIEGYKRTVVYDPSKSETYRAIQEMGYGDRIQEIPVPVQTKVFHPNRMVPGKKPMSPRPAPNPNSQLYAHVNSLGANDQDIAQSGSFKRLMYSVLGETDY